MKAVLTFFMAVLPGGALAHSGDHSGFQSGALLTHLSAQPDHAAIFLLVLVAGVALTWRIRRRK